MVGLNNGGKTTILLNLCPHLLDDVRDMEGVNQISTCPTAGVSLVEFSHDRARWRVWDVSGQGKFRNLWGYYSGHVQAIVYVIDVSDGDRIATARDELSALLDMPRVREKRLPILLFANKSDLGNGDEDSADPSSGKAKSLSIDNVRMALGVDSISNNHKVKVQSSSGLTGSGVAEGFVWLNDAIRRHVRGEELD